MNDLRSLGFWVTIVGVYLAAIAGFDAALKLTLVTADRGTYYVAESMRQELGFNVENMEKYIENAQKEKLLFKEHIAGIKLNDYVFQASKYSNSTFEIDPKLLSEVSIYYFSVGNAIELYYDSGMQSPSNVMAVVKRETEKLKEQNTLANLATYNKALAKVVEEQGISLGQPGSKL